MAEERVLPTSDPEPQLLDRPRGRLALESGGHNLQKTRAPELAEAIVAML